MSHSPSVSVLKTVHSLDPELKGHPSPCGTAGSRYHSLRLCFRQKVQLLEEGSQQRQSERGLACSQHVADHQGT